MEVGHFYYINDKYFTDFPDKKLMQNKEATNGQAHDHPCCYAFYDEKSRLYWMVPLSSQVAKYKGYYNQKMKKYNRCDTIAFGQVLGHEKAFLLQNMCPILPKYIKNEYIDTLSNTPVRIDGKFEKELTSKAKKVLTLQRQGLPLIFPDVLSIENILTK